jgi:hypothetical protein
MKHRTYIRLAVISFVFGPTVSACALVDIAGNVDAGSVAGQTSTSGTGGAQGDMGGQSNTGDSFGTTGGQPSTVGSNAATGGTFSSGDGTIGVGGSTASFVELTGIDCSTTAPNPLPIWATADGCLTGNESAEIVGTWEGTIQGAADNEASTMRLQILGANSNGLCGTVTFGIHTAAVTLPPVTDPSTEYPPDMLGPSNYPLPNVYSQPILGLPYAMQNGTILGERATFQIGYKEVFKEWCEVQKSYPMWADCTVFSCEPGNGRSTSEPTYSYYTEQPNVRFYDTIERMTMCKGSVICQCNVEHCIANRDGLLLFDLTFDGDQAIGSFNGQDVVQFARVTCIASGASCSSDNDCCSGVCQIPGTCQ